MSMASRLAMGAFRTLRSRAASTGRRSPVRRTTHCRLSDRSACRPRRCGTAWCGAIHVGARPSGASSAGSSSARAFVALDDTESTFARDSAAIDVRSRIDRRGWSALVISGQACRTRMLQPGSRRLRGRRRRAPRSSTSRTARDRANPPSSPSSRRSDRRTELKRRRRRLSAAGGRGAPPALGLAGDVVGRRTWTLSVSRVSEAVRSVEWRWTSKPRSRAPRGRRPRRTTARGPLRRRPGSRRAGSRRCRVRLGSYDAADRLPGEAGWTSSTAQPNEPCWTRREDDDEDQRAPRAPTARASRSARAPGDPAVDEPFGDDEQADRGRRPRRRGRCPARARPRTPSPPAAPRSRSPEEQGEQERNQQRERDGDQRSAGRTQIGSIPVPDPHEEDERDGERGRIPRDQPPSTPGSPSGASPSAPPPS